MGITVNEVRSKSIIVPSKVPGAEYVINPYSGCLFGCVYCYADFMRKFTGHMDDEWGEYVDVRVNAIELARKNIDSLNKKIMRDKSEQLPTILFSTVTDPYQPVERKYKLTRGILEVILESGFPGEISILTKSPIVLRDIDILKQFESVTIGLTITSTDNEVSKLFEKGAPPASERLKALEELNRNNLSTYAFVGPLLPTFVTHEEILGELFTKIEKAGTKEVWVEHLNLSWNKLSRLKGLIGEELGEEVLKEFERSKTDNYKEELNLLVQGLIAQTDLKLVGGDVLDHQKDKDRLIA